MHINLDNFNIYRTSIIAFIQVHTEGNIMLLNKN